MLRVESNSLPCLVVCEPQYCRDYTNLNRNYKKLQEILLLDIKNDIYKIEIQDENMIQNPRYFIQEKSFLIECNKNGKITSRNKEYCVLYLCFIKEILIPRISYEFEKLLTIDNNLLEEEINRLGTGKPIFREVKDTNLENIEVIQNYWQNIIYKRFKNKSYQYNGADIDYFQFI